MAATLPFASSDITLSLPALHPAQSRIKAEARRFNVLACGRRFGKTLLLSDLAYDIAIDEALPVGWFAPTYKILTEAWREMHTCLAPIITRSNQLERRIELLTDGTIEFWSLDDPNAGRSRKYARVIVDEAGLVKDLAQIWNASIRPTLADYEGDAYLGGTPKGRNGFWELWEQGGHVHDWARWQLPTDANPYIPREEIAAMRASMPALIVAQELDAEFTTGELNLFRAEHIAQAEQGAPTCVPPQPAQPGRSYLTSVDIGRRQDATVINTFDITQEPYTRVAFDRLERVPYPIIQQAIEARAGAYPGSVYVESNGVGDPVIENLSVAVEPFVTTAKSKVQALQALQLLLEKGRIKAQWDARERAALTRAAWDDAHTADEVMSLAIAAAQLHTGGGWLLWGEG